jgi:Helicase associated domain
VQREGHARVPQRHHEDGFDLGRWVNTNRQAQKLGKLEQQRVMRLEQLPGWLWDPLSDAWEEGFDHLTQYVEREGSARVQRHHREDEFDLGAWVSQQRTERRLGRLSDERASRLAGLPGWIWNMWQTSWEEGYSHLRAFAVREGHARVHSEHREGGFALGQWVLNQRGAHRRGKLTLEQVRRLEELPEWVWDAKHDGWNEYFTALQCYVAREGHARVPTGHIENDLRLGYWVSTQRTNERLGALDPKRKELLEALPGWMWNAVETRWEEQFSALEQFVDREGDARVPRGYVDSAGRELGRWVARQRYYRRNKPERLSDKQQSRLEALAGWSWSPYESAERHGFEVLTRFVSRNGHARVPHAHMEDDYPLGRWVTSRRNDRANGKLSQDLAERLEGLPGWVWDTRTADWESGFAALRRFADREGHPQVPKRHVEDGFRLGMWLSGQRSSYAKGRMSPDRVRRFEQIPRWVWDIKQAAWEENFAALQRFVAREGHAQVPTHHIESKLRLGKWVSHQRQHYKRRTLDPQRARRLLTTPGWAWDVRERGGAG